MTDTEIDKLVEAKIAEYMRNDPAKMLGYLNLIAGQRVVEANASEMTFSQCADIDKCRYKIKMKVEVEKLKQ